MITNDFIFKLSYKDYGVTIVSTFFTISINGMTSLYLKAPNTVQIFIADNITSEGGAHAHAVISINKKSKNITDMESLTMSTEEVGNLKYSVVNLDKI